MKLFCYGCSRRINRNHTFAHEYLHGEFYTFHHKCWAYIDKRGPAQREVRRQELQASTKERRRPME